MAAKRLRYVALALGAAWACWWVFFATAEAIASRRFGGEAILFFVEMFGTVAIAWKWPAIGGLLFLLAGAVSIALYAPMWIHRFNLGQVLILFAIMPAPPVAAGILLLLSRRHAHASHPAAA